MSRTPTPQALEMLGMAPLGLPGAPLPAPHEAPPPVAITPASALADIIDDAVLHAFAAKDARAYMEHIATHKPDLFFKYVALAVEAKKAMGGAPRTASIISPLAPSPLDRPMSS